MDAARRLSAKCLYEAISRHGQDLRNAQVVGEDLADLIIGYFAASSAMNRLLQMKDGERNRRATVALGRLTAATYLEQAWRLFFRLRPVLFADAYARRLADAFDRQLHRLHLPFDPVREIHVLTDDLYHEGRYRFE